MRLKTIGFVLLFLALLAPWPVAAQEQSGSIQGVVKDTSGGVLPGVTVEARSPRVSASARRSPTTRASTGSRRCRRDSTKSPRPSRASRPPRSRTPSLALGQSAQGRPDPQVGGVTETVQVTGESPLIDVKQNASFATMSAGRHRPHPEGPRLHVRHPDRAGRADRVEGRRHPDRRRVRFREPVHHRRHGHDERAQRHVGQDDARWTSSRKSRSSRPATTRSSAARPAASSAPSPSRAATSSAAASAPTTRATPTARRGRRPGASTRGRTCPRVHGNLEEVVRPRQRQLEQLEPGLSTSAARSSRTSCGSTPGSARTGTSTARTSTFTYRPGQRHEAFTGATSTLLPTTTSRRSSATTCAVQVVPGPTSGT